MQTLYTPVSTLYEIKQSKFFANLVPYSDFETTLERLKSEHPKARHFVTAFRYLNEHAQVVEGSSDDGEPKGTSGKPSLAVLAGNDLINVAAITVRYFGGTKLGTGGLARAYTQALSDAVARAETVPYVFRKSARFECAYSDVKRVEYELKQAHITGADKSYEADKVVWKIEASEKALDRFFSSIGRHIRKI
jgi:uncharacterized YigZ family protein